MRKIWFLIVGFFAVASLLVGCGAEREVGAAPVTQERADQLQEKQAEVDQLKLEKLQADKEELEAELAEKEAKEEKVTAAEDKDARYIKALHTEVPQLRDESDAKLVELGEMVCSQIKDGVSALTLNEITKDSGFTEDESTTILGSAIGVYCPEELDGLS